MSEHCDNDKEWKTHRLAETIASFYRLSTMMNATHDIQKVLLWCAVNGGMSEGQKQQIKHAANFIAKGVRHEENNNDLERVEQT